MNYHNIQSIFPALILGFCFQTVFIIEDLQAPKLKTIKTKNLNKTSKSKAQEKKKIHKKKKNHASLFSE